VIYREALESVAIEYEAKAAEKTHAQRFHERTARTARELLAGLDPKIADKNLDLICGSYHYDRPNDVYACDKLIADHGDNHSDGCVSWHGKASIGGGNGSNVKDDLWQLAADWNIRASVETALRKL
jgi:hypothetical protein